MALWLMVFGHLERKHHLEHLRVVVLEAVLEAGEADKHVPYVIMDPETEVLVVEVVDKVVMEVQAVMVAEALSGFI
jgi:hypothetical protein